MKSKIIHNQTGFGFFGIVGMLEIQLNFQYLVRFWLSVLLILNFHCSKELSFRSSSSEARMNSHQSLILH